MIIRQLREDEYCKSQILFSTAFNYPFDAQAHKEDKLTTETWGAFLDDGETLTSMIYPNTYSCRYGNTYLPCLAIGGVATLPQYRRSGGIRAIFEKLFDMAPERGWALSMLYPFSYDYYRKYGYERVLRRKNLEVSCDVLSHIPRNTNAELYTDQKSQLPILLDVYERFSQNFQLIFKRPAGDSYSPYYSDNPHKSQSYTYIWKDSDGKAQAYAVCSIRDSKLTVRELCYTSAEALYGMIGFLRMYEGQVHGYRFEGEAECTPLELLMTDYWNVKVELSSSAMGRVILTETLLKSYDYPDFAGTFTLAVDDKLPCSRGTFRVTYGGGTSDVQKLSDDPMGDADLIAEMPALSRLMLCTETLDLQRAPYLPGLTVNHPTGAQAFFHAFRNRPRNLYTGF